MINNLQQKCLFKTNLIKQSVDAFASAMRDMKNAADMAATMKAAAEMVLASDQLQKYAELVEKSCREALAEAMESSGCTRFETDQQKISLVAGRRSVIISDPALIPQEFMRHPDPAPDKTLIANVLKNGFAVPGAVLNNGGAPTLQFKAKINE